MIRNLFGLVAGPIILTGLGFLFFGVWGAVIGFFVLIAALVFVPLLGAGTAIMGPSLPMVLLVANTIPFGFYLLNCTGRACPSYTLAAAAPMYVAATFCGFVYWLLAARRR
jgi:hypothetical protein